jgi:glycosyltransferase involved in cell wall biosynthesis
MTEKKLFLARSKNPLEELRVANILDTVSTSSVPVVLHFWNRNPSDSVHLKTQSSSVTTSHPLEHQAGYNRGLASLFGQIRWQLFVLVHIFREKPSMIYACDLDSAIVPFIYRWLNVFDKPIFIFDEFDSFATRNDKFGSFAKFVFFALEKVVFARADYVIVASNERKRDVSNIVIQNLPKPTKAEELLQRSVSPKVSYVGLLQGDRGLVALMKAVEMKSNWRCTICGFGELFGGLASSAPANVLVLGELSQDATLKEFSESWLTVATYDPEYGNNRLAASTKVLQSLIAHTPVVVSKGGVLEELVIQNGLGWTIEHDNITELTEVLTKREKWNSSELNTFVENSERFIAGLKMQQASNESHLSQILKRGRWDN